MTIKDIIANHAISQSQLSRLTGIPLRTVQHWAEGTRKPPEWLPKMIDSFLRENEQ